MTIARQIGWSTEANLLHGISRQLDRAISILTCCTTTSTTTIAPTTTTTTTGVPTTTTTTTLEPFFMMKFDSLDNADLMIGGDSADVADWNTFFDLPTNGTPFDNIALDGVLNTVTLYGGGNMTLSAYLFGDNDPSGNSLLEVEDNGVTVACEDGVFSDFNVGSGCYALTKCYLIGCLILGDWVFASCETLNDLSLPFDNYINLGTGVFAYNEDQTQWNFPNLLSCGESCFAAGRNLISINFPLLITITGVSCFQRCSALSNPVFPSLTTVGYGTFMECTGLISISLPVCTDLGGTTGDDQVFDLIIGKTITITIPHALETDGDITWLVANNTVTINYSD